MMEEVVKYLYEIPRFARTGGLCQTQERLRLLGNPEKNFHYIHVAGTNGKGSVCAYMEAALRRMGFKTGLFTSPHLIRINERIRSGNEEISDEAFIRAFHRVKELIDRQMDEGIPHPTFFEFIYLMAMCAFEEAGIVYGVIETGLGGRLDLTNAVEKPDLTVITSISLDHTAILGDTVEKIASEKAGIIKPHVPLVYLARTNSVSQVIEDQARSQESTVFPVRTEWIQDVCVREGRLSFAYQCPYFEKYDIILNTGGIYQAENASLALTGLEVMFGDRFRDSILAGIESMQWAGRMEAVAQNVYVDGAHNDDGIQKH